MAIYLTFTTVACSVSFVAGCLYEHLRRGGSYDLLHGVAEPPSNVRKRET